GDLLLDTSISSDLSYKTPIVLRIVKTLVEHGCLPEAGNPRAELVLDEALTNAILHGNDCDPSKKVHLQLFADEARWGAIVEDEGEGFGPGDLAPPDDILGTAGRGILLMDSYVDELLYNAEGNRVMLTRRRQAEPIAGKPVVPAPEVPAGAGPVSVTQDGGVAVVEVLQPRISQENILPIREALSEALERSPAVVLDLQRVGYLTSIFLGLVVSTHRQLRSRGGWLVLSGLQAPVREILESVALDKLLETAPSRDEAVALLKEHLKDAE
ncbi:MAG: ATP-binding protein, partial [Planctomycetota bacterium]